MWHTAQEVMDMPDYLGGRWSKPNQEARSSGRNSSLRISNSWCPAVQVRRLQERRETLSLLLCGDEMRSGDVHKSSAGTGPSSPDCSLLTSTPQKNLRRSHLEQIYTLMFTIKGAFRKTAVIVMFLCFSSHTVCLCLTGVICLQLWFLWKFSTGKSADREFDHYNRWIDCYYINLNIITVI